MKDGLTKKRNCAVCEETEEIFSCERCELEACDRCFDFHYHMGDSRFKAEKFARKVDESYE